MEVIALVGPSGTGKSHRAILVAQDYQVEAIIDDGLLIQGSRIVAGSSSKRQTTKVGAIKTALFVTEAHAQEIRNALANLNPARLLVLGTSPGMVNRITERLDIPLPAKILCIDEVATPKEIERARYIRGKYGKHVVPAPTVELKPRFSGTLIDPLQTWLSRRNTRDLPGRKLWVEQSVVRPSFSFLGNFSIANNVVVEIIQYLTRIVPDLHKIGRVQIESSPAGVILTVEITLNYGRPLVPIAMQVQSLAVNWVEHMTSLHVLAANLIVKGLHFPE